MEMKNKQKISVLTSYDYTTASLCDEAGIDILLVGDSAGMIMLGYENTIPVTMEQMCLFTIGVNAGRKNSLVVADLPFMSYQSSISDAITNSGRLIKAGADAVKMEGGSEISRTVSALVDIGIPVMGHIGLQPQTTTLSQGYKVQGDSISSAMKLVKDAKKLEKAGVFSIVLEMVTSQVSQIITKSLNIPTIGIGSGLECDGQVLVLQDMLGMYQKINPKFVKRYLNLSKDITNAVKEYKEDIQTKRFPMSNNTFTMDVKEFERLKRELESQDQ